MTDLRRPPVLLGDATVPSSTDDLGAGWRIRNGFALPSSPWDLADRRWLCAGSITHPAQAEAAVMALSRGVGLALWIAVEGDVRHRLLEDLHRLGDVRATSEAATGAGLGSEHRLLLDALAGGSTLAEAARAVHLSARTAHRRLTEVRSILGVGTTAEAVVWWRRPPDGRAPD